LRIASFNLESLDDGPGVAPPLDQRIPVLAPMLERCAADILCLQEVNAQKIEGRHDRNFAALEKLLAAADLAGYHWAHSTKWGGGGLNDHHNLVTLSRLPIEATAQLWHDRVPEPHHPYVTADPPVAEGATLRWDRPVLYTRLTLPVGPALHVYNVHLRAPLACPVPGQKAGVFAWESIAGWAEGFYMSEIKRAGQAFELRLALESIFDADEGAHICIAGDFNAEETHTPVEILRGDEDNTGNGALAARVMVPVEHSLPADRRFTVIHQGRHQMLDHILCSRALMGRYVGSEIHNEALTDEVTGYNAPTPSPVSYHAPVAAIFDYK
jgi:endonuclease/exonuclease/phosphatase family metal-dependent hydrolase